MNTEGTKTSNQNNQNGNTLCADRNDQVLRHRKISVALTRANTRMERMMMGRFVEATANLASKSVPLTNEELKEKIAER